MDIIEEDCKFCFQHFFSESICLIVSFHMLVIHKCDVDDLRDLIHYIQFKKREKHPSRSFTFSNVAD